MSADTQKGSLFIVIEGLDGAGDMPLAVENTEIPGLEPTVAPAKKDEASSSNLLLHHFR